jgi:hypothetical protein
MQLLKDAVGHVFAITRLIGDLKALGHLFRPSEFLSTFGIRLSHARAGSPSLPRWPR